MNLVWKLAQVVRGTTPESLLDIYHAERHPVGARVLRHTMAEVALASPDDRHQALRETVGELAVMEEPRRRLAGMLSALDIHYDLGEGHPLVGRRVPDLGLRTAGGFTRLYALLHDARPLLLKLTGPGAVDIPGWADRVRVVDAEYEGRWELLVIGEVAACPAVLVRRSCRLGWSSHRPRSAARARVLVRRRRVADGGDSHNKRLIRPSERNLQSSGRVDVRQRPAMGGQPLPNGSQQDRLG